MKESAGALLWRRHGKALEVLLVHAAGAYNRRSPWAWGIPKGLVGTGESLEDTARRETFEETSVRPGALVFLGTIDYRRSRKRIHAFVGQAPEGALPRPDSREVDRAEFLDLERARALIHRDQAALLDRLLDQHLV